MEAITRYGDVGTPERHKKFGGARVNTVDGQELAVCIASDLLQGYYVAGIFSPDEKDTARQICQDYEIGCLSRHSPIVKAHYQSVGRSDEDWEKLQDKCHKAYSAALKSVPEGVWISDFCHVTLSSEIGVYIRSPERLRWAIGRLARYYR